jgi:hypothetical protein
MRIAPILFLAAFACGGAIGPTTTVSAGYQNQSPARIMSDAAHALKSVHSAHVNVQATSRGSPVTAEIDVEDQDMSGQMSIREGTFKMIVFAGKVYINGPDLVSMMRIGDPAVAAQVTGRVGNKWVLLPSDMALNNLAANVFGEFSAMGDCLEQESNVKKLGTSTIGGESVVQLYGSSGMRVFVQASSPHYPLRIEFLQGGTACSGGNTVKDSGAIEFSKIGSQFGIKTPADFADLRSLGLTYKPV